MTITKEQEAALGHLMQTHYAPSFVKACAERGLQITDEAHLQELMEVTAQVKEVQHQQALAGGQREATAKAAHALNTALYGEEKAAEIAAARQPAAPAPAAELTKETKQALAVLATPAAPAK